MKFIHHKRAALSPLEKHPGEVIHDQRALDAYLDAYFASEGITFEHWLTRFSKEPYESRNRAIVNAVREYTPRRVFEFACAAGFLAEVILEGCPGIEQYTISNFSPRMVTATRRQLERFACCDVRLIDAEDRDNAMNPVELQTYDTFITTSFEHIQHDIALIESLPRGSAFVFSVAGFDDVEHFRVFTDQRQIHARYAHVLDIAHIWLNKDRSKMVVASRRR